MQWTQELLGRSSPAWVTAIESADRAGSRAAVDMGLLRPALCMPMMNARGAIVLCANGLPVPYACLLEQVAWARGNFLDVECRMQDCKG